MNAAAVRGPGLARGVVLAVLAVASACAARARPVVETRGERIEHGVELVPAAERSELWFSYQIEVLAIDGVATTYRAPERALYGCLVLPPGRHVLALGLEYRAPLAVVRSDERVELEVELDPGGAYRLIDLNAGRKRGHVFVPALIEGAPPDERIELQRPGRSVPESG
jgi:hypothetical protein